MNLHTATVHNRLEMVAEIAVYEPFRTDENATVSIHFPLGKDWTQNATKTAELATKLQEAVEVAKTYDSRNLGAAA